MCASNAHDVAITAIWCGAAVVTVVAVCVTVLLYQRAQRRGC